MQKTVMYLPILMMVAMTSVVFTYPTGAPESACKDMVPNHPPTTTSGSPSYVINITDNVYSAGSVIQGTIYSTSGVLFRGFLIQARAVNDVTSDTIGTFMGNENITHNQCGQGNKQGLTHSNNDNKSHIEFSWTAPDMDHGDIMFRVTIVESFSPSRFWLNITSDVITSSYIAVSSDAPTTGTNTASMTTGSITMTTTPQQKTTQGPGGIHNDPDCGKTKGCFPDCTDSSCDFLVTWQHESSTTLSTVATETVTFDIQMMMEEGNDVWMAIGLSPEGKMDKTNVAACLSQASGITVQSSYNDKYSNVVFPNATMGLTLLTGSLTDGIFRCRFRRQMNEDDSLFYDLSDKFFLLVGTGPVVSGKLGQHTKIPTKSSEKIDFRDTDVSGEDDSASLAVKLHASFMTVAWVFLSSVGVVTARQCKQILPDIRPFNLKVWFHIHRTSMLLTVLSVIAGIVIIFYENGGFKEIVTTEPGRDYTKAHPYMGLSVGGFTLLNPIMAFFRPNPDSQHRYLFNLAHLLVGMSAHIVAVVTIFFGIGLEKSKISNTYAVYVMTAYVIAFLLIEVILEFYNRSQTSKIDYDTIPDDQALNKSVKSPSSVREYLLICHVLLMMAISAFLVIIICQPSNFHK